MAQGLCLKLLIRILILVKSITLNSDLKRTLIGLWLAILYVISTTLVVFSLSNYQLQEAIYTIPVHAPGLDSAFIYHECDLSKLSPERELPLQARGTARIPCIAQPSTQKQNYYTPAEVINKYREIMVISAGKIEVEALRKKASMDKLRDLQLQYRQTPDNQIKMQIAFITGNVTSSTKRLIELNKAHNVFIQQSENVISTISDIQYYEQMFSLLNTLFGVDNFWAVPRHILTIMLIFSMGALGSLIFLTIEFLKQSHVDNRFSVYFFRPFLGMVIALAVYVMYKSGQAALGVDKQEHLSPFLISFISIMSGMLAERAYGNLRLAGDNFFKQDKDQQGEN